VLWRDAGGSRLAAQRSAGAATALELGPAPRRGPLVLAEKRVVRKLVRELEPDELLDRVKALDVVLACERDRLALRAGSGGPADAVHVVLGVERQVEVDDVGHPLDVEPARGDVGRDEEREAAFAEVLEDAEPLPLLDVSGDLLGHVAVRGQGAADAIRRALHVAEEGALRAFVLEQPEERRIFSPDRRGRRRARRPRRSPAPA
jgi:hypothetical protein